MNNLTKNQKKIIVITAFIAFAAFAMHLARFRSAQVTDKGYIGACVVENKGALQVKAPTGQEITVPARGATCYFKSTSEKLICGRKPVDDSEYEKIKGSNCYAHKSIAKNFKKGKRPCLYGVRVVDTNQKANALFDNMTGDISTTTRIRGL